MAFNTIEPLNLTKPHIAWVFKRYLHGKQDSEGYIAAEGLGGWWKDQSGGDKRDQQGRGMKGRAAMAALMTPSPSSFTVSQRIKCQTNQSSTKQTSIAQPMMAFTSLGCISIKKKKKKRYEKLIVPKQPAHPHHQASLSTSSSFVLQLFIRSLSLFCLQFLVGFFFFSFRLCLLQFFHCVWLMSNRQGL